MQINCYKLLNSALVTKSLFPLAIDFALRIYNLALTHSNSQHLIKFKQLSQIFGILCYGEADQKLRLFFRLFLDEHQADDSDENLNPRKSETSISNQSNSTLQENQSTSSEDSETGWIGEKKSATLSTISSKIQTPTTTPTKTIQTVKLESKDLDVNNNKIIQPMKLNQFISMIKTLYGFCRGEDNEADLYRSLSEMCNLLVEMGYLENFDESLSQSVNKNIEENSKEENAEDVNLEVENLEANSKQEQHKHDEDDTCQNDASQLNINSSPKSVSSVIKARLQQEEKNKDKWRVNIVQFLAAVHSEENLHNWFSKPRCLYNKFIMS